MPVTRIARTAVWLPTEALNSNLVFRRFISDLQEAVLTEQIRFVKEVLKMQTLVMSLNYITNIPLTLLRRHFDVIDNHKYLDHPSFPEKAWSLPNKFRQTSSISHLAILSREMMASRQPNKPFLITEFNFVNPNVFRAESDPLIGEYATLHDWDALYRFTWSHSTDSIIRVNGAYSFNMAGDPLAQFSDRIAISMFLRGDVASAKNIYTYAVPSDCFEQNLGSFPSEFTNLGLISAIGSAPQDARDLPSNSIKLAPAEAKNPASVKDARIATLWRKVNETKVAESATGQLRLDANANSFTVTTPRTKSVTLNSGNLVAGTLRVCNTSCFQTVAAISLDGKELPQSNSILVFQLTNIANTGLLFGDESK